MQTYHAVIMIITIVILSTINIITDADITCYDDLQLFIQLRLRNLCFWLFLILSIG